jgi:hypothetical protein
MIGQRTRFTGIGPMLLAAVASCAMIVGTGYAAPKPADTESLLQSKLPWLNWQRAADNPAFTTEHGNNHDSILFVEPDLEYPYHLIISHQRSGADLWRTKNFSHKSEDWELVSDDYDIARHYEFDDGVKVDGTYYIFEAGNVYTFDGPLEEGDGQWQKAGTFPVNKCEDLGVFYEDGLFHIFGEFGRFPHGPDGTSLSHLTSPTGLGDWTMVNPKAADANPDGGHKYGVGDPTIAKIDGAYYIFCDRETKASPYQVIAWRADDLNKPFKYLGVVIKPRWGETDDWDNHRVQDADIAYIPELGRYVMTCNMMDTDGNPGGDFPNMRGQNTRVIGIFYSDPVDADKADQ